MCKEVSEGSTLYEENIKRVEAFAARRNEIMNTKPCSEVIHRFDANGEASMEIIFNSKFVNLLNFEFEEFIQKILLEGVPK